MAEQARQNVILKWVLNLSLNTHSRVTTQHNTPPHNTPRHTTTEHTLAVALFVALLLFTHNHNPIQTLLEYYTIITSHTHTHSPTNCSSMSIVCWWCCVSQTLLCVCVYWMKFIVQHVYVGVSAPDQYNGNVLSELCFVLWLVTA